MKEDIKKFYKGELDEEIKLILHDRGRFYFCPYIRSRQSSLSVRQTLSYYANHRNEGRNATIHHCAASFRSRPTLKL